MKNKIVFGYEDHDLVRLYPKQPDHRLSYSCEVPRAVRMRYEAALKEYEAAAAELQLHINEKLGAPSRRGFLFNCSSG